MIPGQGTKIPHAMLLALKTKEMPFTAIPYFEPGLGTVFPCISLGCDLSFASFKSRTLPLLFFFLI